MPDDAPTTIPYLLADGKVDKSGRLVYGSAFAEHEGRNVRMIRQHQRWAPALGAGPVRISANGERAWVDVTFAPTAAAQEFLRELEFLREQGIKYAPSVGGAYTSRDVRLPGAMTAAERAMGAREVIDRVSTLREVSTVDFSDLPGHTLEIQRADGEAVEFSEVVYFLERDDGEPEAKGEAAEPPEAPDNAAEAAPAGGEGDASSSTVAESDKIAMAVELASARDTRDRVGRLLDA